VTGFFQRLFSKREAPQETSPPPLAGRLEIEEFGHNLVSIAALDFIGQQANSPNQRYRLIWADRAPDGRRGGYRNDGHGSWTLLLDDRIVTTGSLERPQEGCVADNGTVILHDWMFGEGLKGRFVAFAPDGTLYVVEALAGVSGLYRVAEGRDPELVVAGPKLVGLAFNGTTDMVACTSDTAYRLSPPS